MVCLCPKKKHWAIDPSNNLSGAVFEGLDYEAIYILDSTIFGGRDWGGYHHGERYLALTG